MKRAMWIAVAMATVSTGTAWSIDQIYGPRVERDRTGNERDKPYLGKIISMTATVINFEGKDAPTEIPVNEIKRIILENSPQALLDGQKYMLDGEYERAVDTLKKEITEDKRREVAEEILFCRAYCTTQLALSGTEDPVDAGKQLLSFINNSPNSFHYLKACELLGDILVSLGKFSDAQKYYDKLSQAPWPDYKIRAQVALGRSYLAQGKAAEADKAFDDAMSNDASGELAEAQRTAARIGKARCMILNGKTDVALRNLREVIDRSEEKHSEVNALAYNALGTALRKSGKTKEAIQAFLHVHLEYNTQPDLDAEAVANLEKLFKEDYKPAHAHDMREVLDDKYKNSRWAKGVK